MCAKNNLEALAVQHITNRKWNRVHCGHFQSSLIYAENILVLMHRSYPVLTWCKNWIHGLMISFPPMRQAMHLTSLASWTRDSGDLHSSSDMPLWQADRQLWMTVCSINPSEPLGYLPIEHIRVPLTRSTCLEFTWLAA